MEFRPKKLLSPHQLDSSVADMRRLGLRLHRFYQEFAAPLDETPTPVNEWLDISRSGAGSQYLASGWHEPEEFGVWGNGDAHALRLRYGSLPERDVVLQLDAEALLPGADEGQQVDVLAGGALLATWDFTNSANCGVRQIDLPRSAAHAKASGAELIVEFRPHKVFSPHDLDPSLSDVRCLGLRLHRFYQEFAAPPAAAKEAETAEHVVQTLPPAGRIWSGLRPRLRRAVLFPLRPVLLPLMRILERRIRSAVESTSLAAQVDAMEQRLELIRAELRSEISERAIGAEHRAELAEIKDAISALVDSAARRHDTSQKKIDYLSATVKNLPTAESYRAASNGLLNDILTPKLFEIERLQIQEHLKLDNLELSSTRAFQSLTTRIATTERLQVEAHLKIDNLNILIERMQSQAQVEVQKLETLESKLDRTVRRSVIPLSADVLAIRNPYGYLLVPTEDPGLVALLAEGTLPEAGTIKVLETLLRPGDTFVDVGAHIGMFTLLSARLVGHPARL